MSVISTVSGSDAVNTSELYDVDSPSTKETADDSLGSIASPCDSFITPVGSSTETGSVKMASKSTVRQNENTKRITELADHIRKSAEMHTASYSGFTKSPVTKLSADNFVSKVMNDPISTHIAQQTAIREKRQHRKRPGKHENDPDLLFAKQIITRMEFPPMKRYHHERSSSSSSSD